MEYSVSLYSFYSAIQKGELTPLGCVEKAAELGFDAVVFLIVDIAGQHQKIWLFSLAEAEKAL